MGILYICLICVWLQQIWYRSCARQAQYDLKERKSNLTTQQLLRGSKWKNAESDGSWLSIRGTPTPSLLSLK